MGFLIKLLAPGPGSSGSNRWAIEAGASIPLNQALGDELTDRLVRLCAAEDATFDGWGTSV